MNYIQNMNRCVGPVHKPVEADQLADARKAAHDTLNAAEKAWYAYAALIEVGLDRTNAFAVYDNIRQARRLGQR